MNYEFPIIKHLDDVLPAIKNAEEFKVYEKDEYIVVNYVMQGNDTFPPILHPDTRYPLYMREDNNAMIRRECRGLIFNKNGKLIRRAFHKFFNMGERKETLNVDFNDNHWILEKLDGSMITPLPLNEGIRWATKMGITDVSMQAEVFVAKNPRYTKLAKYLLEADLLPIYEWCSPKNRIVIDHKEDNLILTAVRNQTHGNYYSYNDIKTLANDFGIPIVKQFDPPEYMESVYESVDMEGIVVSFYNGHKVKVKSDWYVAIHRAKDNLLHEKRVLELILDNKLDDILPHLPEPDKEKLLAYQQGFLDGIKETAKLTDMIWSKVKSDGWTRKEFALNMASNLEPYWPAIIFTCWNDGMGFLDATINIIRKNLSSQSTVDKVRHLWNENLKWNYGATYE